MIETLNSTAELLQLILLILAVLNVRIRIDINK
jgi:hypothetical protein